MAVKQRMVEAIRARTFETCRNISTELGCALHISHHFIQRFNLRSSSQLAACGALQVSFYAIKNRHSALIGKRVLVQVDHHNFVFSIREKQIACVTFWQYGAHGKDIDERIIIS